MFLNSVEAKEAADAKVEAKGDEGKYGVNYGGGGGNYGGGGGNYGGGGRCHHGCCNRGYGGSCSRCCASPEEAKAFAENQAEAKQAADTKKVEAKGDQGQYGVNYGGGGGGGNYGGGGGNYGGGGGNYGGGGGCHHGCCNRGYRGSCYRCCASPEEAKAFSENQAEAKAEEGQYGVNYGGGGGGNYGGGGGGGGSGWGGRCHHGCCNRGYGGSCSRCCVSPAEAKALGENKEAKSGEGKYGVNYGGGGGNYGGGGGNYGGGGGGGCHHACCNRGYGGSCNRCCSSPEEAKAFAENQSRP